MNDLERAKKYLSEHADVTVVFCRGDELLSSKEHGVKPLLDFLKEGVTFEGGAAADKVIGRGAALLHVMLKTQTLYANVLSASAAEVLDFYKVDHTFGEKAEKILNRRGDGTCPIEQATEGILDLKEGYEAIVRRLQELQKGGA